MKSKSVAKNTTADLPETRPVREGLAPSREKRATAEKALPALRLQYRFACARNRETREEPSVDRNMSKGDLLEMEGVIQDALGGGQYTIKVDQGGAVVRAQLSGRMRRHHIRVLPGDRVRVAVSPYDLTHGLIVYRGK